MILYSKTPQQPVTSKPNPNRKTETERENSKKLLDEIDGKGRYDLFQTINVSSPPERNQPQQLLHF